MAAQKPTTLSGRLKDVQKSKLSTDQILRALDSDEELKRVAKETGMAPEDIGREARNFVMRVSGAWKIVERPLVINGEMCW
jgi:hypothetical protein